MAPRGGRHLPVRAAGFLAGMHLQPATYDLTSYAIVGGTLVLAACAITAVLMLRWRAIRTAMRALPNDETYRRPHWDWRP